MKYLPLAARVCLALIFLKAGINHLMGFSDFADMLGQRLPLGSLLAAATITFQLLGSLSLLLGYKTKIGALLLVLFLIPASLMFHNFVADPTQINSFLKNLGLIGGLLMVIDAGAGAVSLDRALKH
ncbi:DoxX family protein [Leptolyngbyaceae cyanobacterium CCMR0082]|uniref:DoxX family protein n=2 Tax=Adonisia turfae TaxID=2950184 RepID=A0A6M0S9P7_9CYAN|nr:DoxX family protein [Adonisia turfae]MDV3347901.1 DoxX family protein [Leptothoe sp. LEGE 181152]NEZ58559.1 DoxX family protein [Adonisia turfae CCMR0081]NEZ65205.1 DoxX family protein [Adonisia turfae CCMR0082]